MGGVADFTGKVNPVAKKFNEVTGLTSKKKKKKLTPAQQQAARNKAARGAAPLLQQTAMSPDEPAGKAGTALL